MLDPTEQCPAEHGPNRCHLVAGHEGMHRWDAFDGTRYRWDWPEDSDRYLANPGQGDSDA